MPHSTRSSSTSAACRLEWRPSRLALAALLALTAGAVVSVLASGLPRAAAWPAVPLLLTYGMLAFRRERRRRGLQVEASPDGVRIDGAPVFDAVLRWRGPLAFLAWRDARGRRHHRVWWPGTLPPARRRELRLAMPAARDAGNGAAVAP